MLFNDLYRRRHSSEPSVSAPSSAFGRSAHLGCISNDGHSSTVIIIHRQAALFRNGGADGSTADLGLSSNGGLNSLVLGGKTGEEGKDGHDEHLKADAMNEDLERDRKVRVCSFSIGLPMFFYDLYRRPR